MTGEKIRVGAAAGGAGKASLRARISNARIELGRDVHDIRITIEREPVTTPLSEIAARVEALEGAGFLTKKVLTQEEYDALPEKDENVLYAIKD